MFSLTVIKPDGTDGAIIPLPTKRVILGSLWICDIRIKRPNIAGRQCEILITPNQEAFIKNLNPALAIRVDDKLATSEEYTTLYPNQVIEIDGRKFIFKTRNNKRKSSVFPPTSKMAYSDKMNQSAYEQPENEWEVENNENIPESAGHKNKQASRSLPNTSESNLIEFSPKESLNKTCPKSNSAFESALEESKDDDDGCITPTNNISLSVESVKRLHSAARKSILRNQEKSLNSTQDSDYATPEMSVYNLVTPEETIGESEKHRTRKSLRASNLIVLDTPEVTKPTIIDALKTPRTPKSPRFTPRRSILTRSRLSSHFDQTMPVDLTELTQTNITLDRFISSESLSGNNSKSKAQVDEWIVSSANNCSLSKPDSFTGEPTETPVSTPNKTLPRRKSARKSSSRLSTSMHFKVEEAVQERCTTPLTPAGFDASIPTLSSTPLVSEKNPAKMRLSKLIESPQREDRHSISMSTPVNQSFTSDKLFKTPKTVPRANSNFKKLRSSKKSLIPEIINLCEQSSSSSMNFQTPARGAVASDTITIIDLVTPRESILQTTEKSLEINENFSPMNPESGRSGRRKSKVLQEVTDRQNQTNQSLENDSQNASEIEKIFTPLVSNKRKSLRNSTAKNENVVLEESLTDKVLNESTEEETKNVSSLNKTYTKDQESFTRKNRKTSQRTPKNDLGDVSGVKSLFSTPLPENSTRTNYVVHSTSTTSINLDNLFTTPQILKQSNPKTPTSIAKSPGRKTPKNDPQNLSDVNNIFATPQNGNTSRKTRQSTLTSQENLSMSDNNLENISEEKLPTSKKSLKKAQKTPNNDLRDVSGMKNLFDTSQVENMSLSVGGKSTTMTSQENLSALNGDVQEVEKTPNNLPKGNERKTNSKKIQGTPKNDLRDISGINNLFTTPQVANISRVTRNSTAGTPQENLSLSLETISPTHEKTSDKKQSASKKIQKTPKNDLCDVSRVKNIFSTPINGDVSRITRKSIAATSQDNLSIIENDLSKLVKTPIIEEKSSSSKQNLKKIPKTPYNDLRDISGINNLFATPQVENISRVTRNSTAGTPKENLSLSLETISPTHEKTSEKKQSTSKKIPKTPKNDLCNVSGIKNIFATPLNGDVSRITRKSMAATSQDNLSISENDLSKLVKTPIIEEKSSSSKQNLRKMPKTPHNDLRDVSGLNNLFSTPQVENISRVTRNSTVGTPQENISLPLETFSPTHKKASKKKQSTSKKIPKTPHNDLRDISGINNLFATPQVENISRVTRNSTAGTPQENLLLSLETISNTPDKTNEGKKSSPKTIPKTPKNELCDVSGINNIFSTPLNGDVSRITRKSMVATSQDNLSISGNDLSRLVKTPIVEEKLSSSKQNLRKNPKTPLNDLRDVSGLNNLFATPQVENISRVTRNSTAGTPKENLSLSLETISPTHEKTSERKQSTSKKIPKTPHNDLRNISGINNIFATPQAENISRVTRNSTAGTPQENLSLSSETILPTREKTSEKNQSTSKKIPKTPHNDLRDISGINNLFATPQVENISRVTRNSTVGTPQENISLSLETISNTPDKANEGKKSSPKKIQKTPKNDLCDVSGIKNIFSTPINGDVSRITRKSIAATSQDNLSISENDLSKLVKTPIVEEKLSSSKQNLKKIPKTPHNDLRDVSGLNNLFATPQVASISRVTRNSTAGTPQENLSLSLETISPTHENTSAKKLSTSKKIQKTPKNDLRDVSGISYLFVTPENGDVSRTTRQSNVATPRDNLSMSVNGLSKLDVTPIIETKSSTSKKNSKKIQKTPQNDLQDVIGVDKLFTTPQFENNSQVTTDLQQHDETSKPLGKTTKGKPKTTSRKQTVSNTTSENVPKQRITRSAKTAVPDLKPENDKPTKKTTQKSTRTRKDTKSKQKVPDDEPQATTSSEIPDEVPQASTSSEVLDDEPQVSTSSEVPDDDNLEFFNKDVLSQWKQDAQLKVYKSPKKSPAKKPGTPLEIVELGTEVVEEKTQQRKTRRGKLQKVEPETNKVQVEKRVTRRKVAEKPVESTSESINKRTIKRKMSEQLKELEEPETKVTKTLKQKVCDENVVEPNEEPKKVEENKRVTRKKAENKVQESSAGVKQTRSTRNTKREEEPVEVEVVEKPTRKRGQKKSQPPKEEDEPQVELTTPPKRTRKTEKAKKQVRIVAPHDLVLEVPTTIKKKRVLFTPKKEGIDSNEDRHNVSMEIFTSQVDPWSQHHTPAERPRVTRAKKCLITATETVVSKTKTKIETTTIVMKQGTVRHREPKTQEPPVSLFSPRKTRSRATSK